MGTKYKVKGVGHGIGYNRYPAEVEIYLPDVDDDEDSENERLFFKARKALQDKTACDCVTVEDIKEIK